MILVTLGTQDKPFTRLLQKIEALKAAGLIQDRVIVQAGYTQFTSELLEIHAYFSQIELDALRTEADLIVTHGGVGSILDGLKVHKKIIAVPRLKRFSEHVNDHQLEIIESFAQEGYILACLDIEDLKACLDEVPSFSPKSYPFDNSAVLKSVLDYILHN